MPSDRSAETFASTRNRNTGNETKEVIMITDALSDVRVKYHIVAKEVGHGHYGVVRKCQNRETKEWFAIKSIRKSKVNKIEVLLREIKILEEVDHPNIINLFEVRNFIIIGLFRSDDLLESELTICGVQTVCVRFTRM